MGVFDTDNTESLKRIAVALENILEELRNQHNNQDVVDVEQPVNNRWHGRRIRVRKKEEKPSEIVDQPTDYNKFYEETFKK